MPQPLYALVTAKSEADIPLLSVNRLELGQTDVAALNQKINGELTMNSDRQAMTSEEYGASELLHPQKAKNPSAQDKV